MMNIVSFINSNGNFIIAISTFAYAVFTGILLFQNNKIFQMQKEPIVQLKIEMDTVYASYLDLLIENIGEGIAYDLQLNIIDGNNKITDFLNEVGIFKTNLPYLGAKETINIRKITTLIDKACCESEFTIEVSYKNFRKNRKKEKFKFNLKYLEGTLQPSLSPEAKIAKTLENIEKIQAKIAGSLNQQVNKNQL